MQKTIKIIIPYFGKLPNYFNLFVKSCEKNPSINWDIITDCSDNIKIFPKNVNIIKSNFENFNYRVKNKISSRISVANYHKICEFKPAYAFLYPELVDGYDYWGYGDMDVIYGNLRKFLSDDVLNADKILALGHFSLLKNETDINTAFMNKINGEPFYLKAFLSSKNFNFDEDFYDNININKILENNGKDVRRINCFADVYYKSGPFRLVVNESIEEKKESIFVWINGELIRFQKKRNGAIIYNEYAYIHLQKRHMQQGLNINNCFSIIPNAFEPLEFDSVEQIKEKFDEIVKYRPNLQWLTSRVKNFMVKIKK